MIKIVAVVQARMNSKRFPGKVLKLIGDKSFIELIVKRLERSSMISKILFALPDNDSSKPIINLLNDINIDYVLGSENNLISRYKVAALESEADYIVRITADCPFIDPIIIDNMAKKMLSLKLDFITNVIPPSWPDGLDVTIFSNRTLSLTYYGAKLDSEKEHLVPWMWNNSNLKNKNVLKAYNYCSLDDLSKHRWTLDTKDDYNFFNLIGKKILWNDLVSMNWKDFLSFFDKNHAISLVNNHHIRDEGYKNSLFKDKNFEI